MVTPTTKNPYLLFGAEPPNWNGNGGTLSWEQHKKDVQQNNTLWWKVHTADGNYPHQMETPLGVEGNDFPLGQGNRYGPFIYCPFPLEGVVRWGFRRADGFAAFRLDVENDTLPSGGAPKASIPSARPRAAAAKVAPIQSVPTGAAPDIADAAHAEPADDFDLMGSAPVEDDPFAALDIDAPAAEAAPAPVEAEPEVDEWGEVIVKPGKPEKPDPFEGLL